MILGRTEGYVIRTLEEVTTVIQQICLQMYDNETKYMINRKDGNKVKEIELMGKRYEKAESFKYLGTVMTSLNEIETEIKSKTAVGNKCYYALGPILYRGSISQAIKIRLYKTIIRPAVTHGAETWMLTSKIEKILMTWKRKILRKMYGPTKEN